MPRSMGDQGGGRGKWDRRLTTVPRGPAVRCAESHMNSWAHGRSTNVGKIRSTGEHGRPGQVWPWAARPRSMLLAEPGLLQRAGGSPGLRKPLWLSHPMFPGRSFRAKAQGVVRQGGRNFVLYVGWTTTSYRLPGQGATLTRDFTLGRGRHEPLTSTGRTKSLRRLVR